MKNKRFRKPAVIPTVESSPKKPTSGGLFTGLNVKALIACFPVQLQPPGAADSPVCPQTQSSSQKPLVKTVFGGTNIKEIARLMQDSDQPKGRQAGEAISPPSQPEPATPIRFSNIPTVAVVDSLLNTKKNKRVKPGTLETYKRHLKLFQRHFPFLPENKEAIIDFLARFDGPSGRHQRNHQDILNMLYTHAVKHFGLKCNPVAELERPLVTHKPVKTLTLARLRVLNQTPQNLAERVALDLLAGHGWRQIEVRRIQARDVAKVEDFLITCHGKEREELAPLLPETIERLREMARDLPPEEYLFRAKQTRHGLRSPLREDGMRNMINELFQRAGLQGYTPHDLRRSFATLVTIASHDEFLALRLIRDSVPGLSSRYIKFPLEQLVEAQLKYSPLRQLGERESAIKAQTESEKALKTLKDSPVSETGESLEKTLSERKNNLVETGEG